MEGPHVSFEVFTGKPGISIPSSVLTGWFERELSLEEVDRIVTALERSDVREAIADILATEAELEI